MRGLLGKKLGMSQVFGRTGNLVPVTVLEVTPNQIVQVKRSDGKDGYNAVKVGFDDVKLSRVTRPMLGVFKSADVDPKRHIGEFRIADEFIGDYEVGQELDVTMFEPGVKVDVTGVSKGRGYQGVVKRHGFKGAKEKTHGTHEYKRHAGSIGCSAYPARVVKGKRMAGQMGNKKATVQALTVVAVFPDQNLMLVKGAVPGPKNGLVKVQVSRKQPEYLPH